MRSGANACYFTGLRDFAFLKSSSSVVKSPISANRICRFSELFLSVFAGKPEFLYLAFFENSLTSISLLFSGVVLVEFTVEEDGSISFPEIKVRLFPDCDENALQIVREMPRWQPATYKGKPVRCSFVLPVTFAM